MAKNMIEVKQADALVMSLEKTFKPLPSLPKGGREFIVMVTPWLAVLFGVLLVVFAGLGTLISLVASPLLLLGGGPQTVVVTIISGVLALVEGVLMVLAFKPLQARDMYGWKLLTYVVLLNVVSVVVNVVSGLMNGGALGGMVVVWSVIWAAFWIAVELYLLFQIKSHYK